MVGRYLDILTVFAAAAILPPHQQELRVVTIIRVFEIVKTFAFTSRLTQHGNIYGKRTVCMSQRIVF